MANTEKAMRLMGIASEALKYKNANPKARTPEIMQYILGFIKKPEYKKDQYEALAVVSKLIKLIEKNPNTYDDEVLKKIFHEIQDMLKK